MVELITHVEPAIMEQLVKLESEAFGVGGMNEWHLVPLVRHGRVYVFREEAAILGAVQYMADWQNRNLAYMVGVSVAAAARGKGIGTKLLRHSIDALFATGVTAVELTVEAANAPAVKVYQDKLRFAITEFRQNEYGPGQDRLVMLLTCDKWS